MHGAREDEGEGNGDVDAREKKRITYSREFLVAVGSSEGCKAPPAGVDMSKHPDDVKLWLLEAASRSCSSRAETWRARSAGRSGGSQGDSPQHGREPESFKTGAKPCTRFFSTIGCCFGENCHFIHNVPGGYKAITNVGVLGDPVSAQDKKDLPMGQRHAGHHAPDEAANPNTAPPPSFGASATAKISVDASLAGIIIGTGGATIRQISWDSGAKLCIRDHDSDAGLKNVELEGTFDQIKNASEMVMEKLSRFGLGGFAPPPAGDKNPAGGSVRGGGQSDCFKTRLCGHFARGCCTYGDGCRFAHSEKELRKPVYAARGTGGW
ncbi:zinc finger CCCH domain-containing protein 14-like [Lolium rigidum]|uniref:zinc finger CCCH domain-containing protein 14-like n=1 Tax=Lolium rigidum TaxID=89674 RepID=UPI001F5CEABB|nr:zinc finger CCCH domain-containing protein 14-like [Lolium rigidum]